MFSPDAIPVPVPVPNQAAPSPARELGNALPLLSEIRHALARLAESGEATIIDLAAIPFGPGDEDRLLALLGRGEVEATIEALGPTRIRETRFPGVWVVDYANAEQQRVALQIEVDQVPQILRTPRADLADSLEALDARIEAAASDPGSMSHRTPEPSAEPTRGPAVETATQPIPDAESGTPAV